MKESKEMMKVKDVQDYLGCGRNKAYAVIKCHDLPSIQIGKDYYIRRSDFNDWISKNMNRQVLV